MKCSKCGAENNAGVKFCINCGSSLGLFCPNCGAANSAGAKFCVSCGNQFGVPAAAQSSAPTQPVVVLKSGTPGWVWAFIGVLAGLLVVGGLIISGILPFGTTSTEQVSPTLQPVVESPDASAEGYTEPVYCPETGGVILYWNAGFDCANDTGDPGYRLRYGDGFQDLNTGQFDDQASSIHIPAGWSVRLYENVEKNGASRCFNTSITNFEDFGNFDKRDLPINDNVTSMQVFRDGTCGQDLAAGAKPAPMPEEEAPPKGAPGAQAGGCDCDCVRGLFPELAELGEDGWWDIPMVVFEGYIHGIFIEDDGNGPIGAVWFDNETGAFDAILNDPDLAINIFYGRPGEEAAFSTKDGSLNCLNKGEDTTICEFDAEMVINIEEFDTHMIINIDDMNLGFVDECLVARDEGFQFGLVQAGDEQPKDCRDPRISCPDKTDCVQSKETGLFYCEKIKTNNEPPTEAPSDSSSGGSSGSGGSSCGGSICEPPSSP